MPCCGAPGAGCSGGDGEILILKALQLEKGLESLLTGCSAMAGVGICPRTRYLLGNEVTTFLLCPSPSAVGTGTFSCPVAVPR